MGTVGELRLLREGRVLGFRPSTCFVALLRAMATAAGQPGKSWSREARL